MLGLALSVPVMGFDWPSSHSSKNDQVRSLFVCVCVCVCVFVCACVGFVCVFNINDVCFFL